MKTFLSVDLDYWNEVKNNFSRMVKYLKSIRTSGIPIVLVKDHEQMLPFVDQSKATSLINLDYHSDLADIFVDNDETPVLGKTEDFNCGTWVNWVKLRKVSHFLWIHPHKSCYVNSFCSWDRKGVGRCDVNKNPFTKEFNTGWKEAKHKTGTPPKINRIPNLTMIGICISPDYISFDQKMPYEILKKAGFDKSRRCLKKPILYN